MALDLLLNVRDGLSSYFESNNEPSRKIAEGEFSTGAE